MATEIIKHSRYFECDNSRDDKINELVDAVNQLQSKTKEDSPILDIADELANIIGCFAAWSVAQLGRESTTDLLNRIEVIKKELRKLRELNIPPIVGDKCANLTGRSANDRTRDPNAPLARFPAAAG